MVPETEKERANAVAMDGDGGVSSRFFLDGSFCNVGWLSIKVGSEAFGEDVDGSDDLVV